MAQDEDIKGSKITSLEQLIAEEKVEKDRQNGILDKRKKENKRRKFLVVVPLVSVAVLLIGGVAIYDPFAQNLRWAQSADDGKNVDGENDSNSAYQGSISGEWWEADKQKFPVEVPPWTDDEAISNTKDGIEEAPEEKTDGDEGNVNTSLERFTRENTLQKQYDAVNKTYSGTTLSQLAIILPSIEGGFTDDTTKAVNEDGSLNGNFSFWTRELFIGEVGSMLNRLMNPVFGGWQTASEGSADDATKVKLGDLFTSQWLAANGADALPIVTSSKAPIEVDYLPSGGTRWVGTITPGSETLNFTYDRGLKGYVVDYSADVTYSSWQQDKKVASFNGKISLKLVPNSQDQNPSSGNRVLISEAALALG